MVKVGTILSGFKNPEDIELYIVASIGEYVLLISTQAPCLGYDTYLSLPADKIKYNCFKIEDAVSNVGWSIDSVNDEKRNINEDKFIARVYN
tara:strand:- start:2201 stop:2476 length:276 start_codon:yes stop_codon:yes gene_type:complete